MEDWKAGVWIWKGLDETATLRTQDWELVSCMLRGFSDGAGVYPVRETDLGEIKLEYLWESVGLCSAWMSTYSNVIKIIQHIITSSQPFDTRLSYAPRLWLMWKYRISQLLGLIIEWASFTIFAGHSAQQSQGLFPLLYVGQSFSVHDGAPLVDYNGVNLSRPLQSHTTIVSFNLYDSPSSSLILIFANLEAWWMGVLEAGTHSRQATCTCQP